MKRVNPTKESLKSLGTHFSNKKLEQEKKLNVILVKIENVLKSWEIRDLSTEGKSKIWKILAISKIVHLLLKTNVLTFIIEQFNIIKQT